jgi:hypothetical protein
MCVWTGWAWERGTGRCVEDYAVATLETCERLKVDDRSAPGLAPHALAHLPLFPLPSPSLPLPPLPFRCGRRPPILTVHRTCRFTPCPPPPLSFRRGQRFPIPPIHGRGHRQGPNQQPTYPLCLPHAPDADVASDSNRLPYPCLQPLTHLTHADSGSRSHLSTAVVIAEMPTSPHLTLRRTPRPRCGRLAFDPNGPHRTPPPPPYRPHLSDADNGSRSQLTTAVIIAEVPTSPSWPCRRIPCDPAACHPTLPPTSLCPLDADSRSRSHLSTAVVIAEVPTIWWDQWAETRVHGRGEEYEIIKAKFEAKLQALLIRRFPQLAGKVSQLPPLPCPVPSSPCRLVASRSFVHKVRQEPPRCCSL